MKWVTREHVHVDRVACPWLIRRFVDHDAEFLFVEPQEVMRAAKREGATPFDAKGQAELDHRDGKCTFEVILGQHALGDPALHRMARIVHAADIASDRGTDPIAPGLEAIAVGFGALFPDDHENLRRQSTVYDALYEWCRKHATGAAGAAGPAPPRR